MQKVLVMYAVLLSGGKDSVLAYHVAKDYGMDIKYALIVVPSQEDSYLYHTPNIAFARYVAECLGIDHVMLNMKKDEEEIKALIRGMKTLKSFGVNGIITGGIRSVYQGERIQYAAYKTSLEVFNPLWLKSDEEILNLLRAYHITPIITRIAAYGLRCDMLGKSLLDLEQYLREKAKKYGLSIIGEGGELETFAVEGKYFSKKIIIRDFEIRCNEERFEGEMIIKSISTS